MGSASFRNLAFLGFGGAEADGGPGAVSGRFAVLVGVVLDWRRGLGRRPIGERGVNSFRRHLGQGLGSSAWPVFLVKILDLIPAARRPRSPKLLTQRDMGSILDCEIGFVWQDFSGRFVGTFCPPLCSLACPPASFGLSSACLG